jgi:hypothetical protein
MPQGAEVGGQVAVYDYYVGVVLSSTLAGSVRVYHGSQAVAGSESDRDCHLLRELAARLVDEGTAGMLGSRRLRSAVDSSC